MNKNYILKRDLNRFLNNKKYYFSDPFPHWIIDGIFDEFYLSQISNTERLLKVASREQKEGWGLSYFNNELETKIGVNNISTKDGVYSFLEFLTSNEFVNFLIKITGIKNLLPDNEFHGGGLHLIPKGGRLGVHIDFSKHKKDTNLWRRCNVLLYLNKNWRDDWGGHLELWDLPKKKGGKCIKKIKPSFNKLVIFGTSKDSWHGHPQNLNCPEELMRASLATYYYSKDKGSDISDHSTIFAEQVK